MLSLWIDAATGIRLRVENSAFGLLEELVELELDEPVDPVEFAHDGPVDCSQQEARVRDMAARDYSYDNPPRVTTMWPRGVGFHVWEGDIATGS